MLHWTFINNIVVQQQMEKYKISRVLGDGAFGTVFQAVNTKTNEVVAIKKIKQKYGSWEQCLQLREIKSLRKLDHPNIAKLKEVLLVKEELHLNNLYQQYSKRKEQNRPFTPSQIKNMLFQIASALAHMHKNGFFHRDLKPQNLLLSGPVVKLCDFGLARQIRSRPPFTDYVSTRWYRAPQLLLRSTTYNSPVDVFAFACIAAQLFNLSPLFPGTHDLDQLGRIVKILGTPDPSEWPQGYKLAKATNYHFPSQIGVNLYKLIPGACNDAIEMLEGCFKFSSRKRMTFLEVLKHDYFKGVSIGSEEEKPKKKNILFQERQKGQAINLEQQHKKIEEFRMTKQKFRETRNKQAFRSDPLKQLEKSQLKQDQEEEDIDNIIRQLEEKKKMKSDRKTEVKPVKLAKGTREKFYTQNQKPKKMDFDVQSFKKSVKTQQEELPRVPSKDKEPIGFQRSKKANIFAYNFQPTSLPFLAPVGLSEKHYMPGVLRQQPKAVAQSLNDSRNRSNNPNPKLNPYMPLGRAYNF